MIPTNFLLLPVLNHLLSQEPWASQQLQTHAGKIACIDFSVTSLRMQITEAGLLQAAPEDVAPNVTIRINLADVPLILQDQQRAISYVKLEGDADLAQTISDLGKNLRPDAEQQLSQLFGDVAGRRMVLTGRAVAENLRTSAQKLQENLAEYFLEENPMLVRPERVAEFAEQVGRTRDDVERLMKRIEKLER
ncbi:ubiquinone biosynthesis protein UbiJ [Oxalobacteraceae bacterium GrIS 2.11]